MKKVYKLANNYFNIEKLRNVTELSVVNDYDAQEKQKEIDKEIDENSILGSDRPRFHIYNNYDKDCMTAAIFIDDKNYTCTNYEVEWNKGAILVNGTMKVTEKQQAKYDEFVSEAQKIIKAFAEL